MAVLDIQNDIISRQQESHKYSLLDTMPDEEYDSVTRFTAESCNTPLCLIALLDVDRISFRFMNTPNLAVSALENKLCEVTLQSQGVFIVQDCTKDERFKNETSFNKSQPVVFFAGTPLTGPNGTPVGVLCVVDFKPSNLNDYQQRFLIGSANNIMKLFELRRSNLDLKRLNMEMGYRTLEMERFAYTAAHDIKSPLNHIIQLNKVIDEELSTEGHEHIKDLILKVSTSAQKLRSLIDGILNHSKSDNIESKVELVDFTSLVESVFSLFRASDEYDLVGPTETHSIKVNKVALERILINLVDNAIKHNDKDFISVEISIVKKAHSFQIFVTDNGPGIDKSHFKKIFKIFEKLNEKDRFGNDTSGIGLATVKKLANTIGATIQVDSIVKCGTTFILEVPVVLD